MPVSELHQMLSDSAESVLETMFFTGLIGDAEPGESSAAQISASLSFHGTPSGSFGVSVPLETGRKIAANFLGLEEEETHGNANRRGGLRTGQYALWGLY